MRIAYWWAVYNSGKGEYMAVTKNNLSKYDTFDFGYVVKDSGAAVTLAAALNAGSEVCGGSWLHGTACRVCIACICGKH